MVIGRVRIKPGYGMKIAWRAYSTTTSAIIFLWVGCRSNQGNFYDRFDHIVALTAPLNVMLDRVERRSNNPFGSSESDRQQITQDKLEFEPMILRGADIVIDTSATSPEDIADQLEALL